jgi:hypothetical protein
VCMPVRRHDERACFPKVSFGGIDELRVKTRHEISHSHRHILRDVLWVPQPGPNDQIIPGGDSTTVVTEGRVL